MSTRKLVELPWSHYLLAHIWFNSEILPGGKSTPRDFPLLATFPIPHHHSRFPTATHNNHQSKYSIMGNDGGSIPTRRELVKNAARDPNTSELKATQQEAQTHHWSFCPLSNRPLVEPIVSDCAGTLYNKEAILEQLLPKDDVPASIIKEKEDILQGRVKGLRDVVEVKFTLLKESKGEKRICPITSKELGPNTKSVYLVPCGHAFSEVAIREVAAASKASSGPSTTTQHSDGPVQPGDEDKCVECNEAYTAGNVITILPLAKEDIAKLAGRATKLKELGLSHSLKKVPGGKKRKKNVEAETFLEGEAETFLEGEAETFLEGKAETNGAPSISEKAKPSIGIKDAATASLTAKVLDEQEERNKRRKLGLNDNLKALFSKTGYSAQTHKGGDFMTRGYSLPKKT